MVSAADLSTVRDPDLSGRRLVFVMRDLGVGGAERQATLLAAGLRSRHGAEVEFWCFDLFGRNRQTLKDAGIEVRELSPGHGGGLVKRCVQLLSFVRRARQRHPELLLPFTDYPNKVCCSLWRVIGARGAVWNQRDEGRERTGRPLEALAVRWASAFVCNSGEGESFLRTSFRVDAERIVRIPNVVVLDPPRQSTGEWRRSLGMTDEQPLVLMVGNLHRYKDHATLLRAWRRVVDVQSGSPVLVLAGRPDTTADELHVLADELHLGESVRFLGEVDDVPGLLRTADLVAHSSVREGCPNGILEPMAAGCAVVATDIEGAREALGTSYEHLVSPGDPEHLASEICRVLGDQGLRRQLGAANRERSLQCFDPDENVRRYAEIVHQVLNGRVRFPRVETL